MNLTLADIARLLHQTFDPDRDVRVTGVSVDSRGVRPGDVFFALPGDRVDGHAFTADAFGRGAVAAVVDAARTDIPEPPPARRLFRVPGVLPALQDLAAGYRAEFSMPVVAVTGTNGKTTTKEMIASVLSCRFRTARTEGNLNNHIGVPLSVCAWDRSREAAVLEMGANHFGEIGRLCEIAKPTHGVITNIGRAHLAFFGDADGVLKAKSELLDWLSADGTAFLNGDDPSLGTVRNRAARTVTFGFGGGCDVSGRMLRADASGLSGFELDGRRYRVPVPGRHNLYNALAAAAVGLAFGVDAEAVQDALGRFTPPGLRTEVTNAGGVAVINDAYNANPSSVEQAVLALKSMSGLKRRAVALGDMLELGDRSEEEHRRTGVFVADIRPNLFLCCGPAMRHAAEAATDAGMRNVRHFERPAEMAGALAEWVREGDGVLIKGSRAMKMETVASELIAFLRNPSGIGG
ncbi:UDP-N-acetylmuramoyl-tripeptide--D-alanyl-D-alanine ligase [bacterium]|nr:UDP-N-acetylmuramoyl-tripeptide--D-alanyl-D-alanine ligase [bacterium]